MTPAVYGSRGLTPDLRFSYLSPDPKGEERRHNADEEDRPPPPARQHDRTDEPRHRNRSPSNSASVPAPCRDGARADAAHQNGTARPLASHAKTKEHAENRQLPDICRQPASKSEDGVDEDAERQRPHPPEAVRDEAARPSPPTADAASVKDANCPPTARVNPRSFGRPPSTPARRASRQKHRAANRQPQPGGLAAPREMLRTRT